MGEEAGEKKTRSKWEARQRCHTLGKASPPLVDANLMSRTRQPAVRSTEYFVSCCAGRLQLNGSGESSVCRRTPLSGRRHAAVLPRSHFSTGPDAEKKEHGGREGEGGREPPNSRIETLTMRLAQANMVGIERDWAGVRCNQPDDEIPAANPRAADVPLSWLSG